MSTYPTRPGPALAGTRRKCAARRYRRQSPSLTEKQRDRFLGRPVTAGSGVRAARNPRFHARYFASSRQREMGFRCADHREPRTCGHPPRCDSAATPRDPDRPNEMRESGERERDRSDRCAVRLQRSVGRLWSRFAMKPPSRAIQSLQFDLVHAVRRYSALAQPLGCDSLSDGGAKITMSHPPRRYQKVIEMHAPDNPPPTRAAVF